MFMNRQNVSILISLLFHLAAPICFGNYVPSSGSSSVPSELHANFGFWLTKFCVLCGFVCITWHVGASKRNNKMIRIDTSVDYS
jgi:hypothetical protein